MIRLVELFITFVNWYRTSLIIHDIVNQSLENKEMFKVFYQVKLLSKIDKLILKLRKCFSLDFQFQVWLDGQLRAGSWIKWWTPDRVWCLGTGSNFVVQLHIYYEARVVKGISWIVLAFAMVTWCAIAVPPYHIYYTL